MAPDPDGRVLAAWDEASPPPRTRAPRPADRPKHLSLPFAASRDDDGETVRVVFSGELDMGAAPSAAAELRRAEESGRPVVVDLSRLRFIDSTGLRAILDSNDRMKATGGRVVVIHGSRAVRRVLELARVHATLEVVEEVAPGGVTNGAPAA